MFYPDLMTMLDGTSVTSAEQWPARRKELLHVLDREQYGLWPAAGAAAQGRVCGGPEPCCGGRARCEQLDITFDTPGGAFSFPAQLLYPADGKRHPLMLCLVFDSLPNDGCCPVNEIIGSGFALGWIRYTDVTSDDNDMTSGLAGCYPRHDPATDWGKLAMWAFAMSRALDYLLTRPEVEREQAAVLGHSRLGKAALLCGAHDERVRYVLANCAGCGGDALEQTRHPGAETYAAMDSRFAYWFCGNRRKYIGEQSAMPYDQHFLLAAIAPRYVALGSAAEDAWADPFSQQLCCVAASPAWTLHGLPGFSGPCSQAAVNTLWHDGCVGYHLREGGHALTREDWLRYLAFVSARLHAGTPENGTGT